MLRREIEPRILESLRSFPVTLLLGARQVGKSTLARALCQGPWPARYVTLDDRAVLDAALESPDSLVRDSPGSLVIDEVQRAPDLLRAIKLEVDRDRQPGRFLLTGSANIATLSRVSETLAGRAAILTLQPFSWAELCAVVGPGPTPVDALFASPDVSGLLRALPDLPLGSDHDLQRFILTGGFPDPAREASLAMRELWFDSYRQTYVERDVRDLAGITQLPGFSRLLTFLAHRTATLLNQSELARDTGLPVSTLRRYFAILAQTYQVSTLPPWLANSSRRLVKTPKMYLGDTGLACHLAGLDDWVTVERQSRVGAMAETFVAAELRKSLACVSRRTELLFWRTASGLEVDFVLERQDRVIGLEVKWGTSIGPRDLSGLSALRSYLGDRFHLGVVLYRGREAVPVGDRIVAVPIPQFVNRGWTGQT